MPSHPEPRRKAALALGLMLLLTEGLLWAAPLLRRPLTFDVGPSTARDVDGFTESEENPPLTFRWARREAAIRLPLVSAGGRATLALRSARFLDQPVTLEVALAGRRLGQFVATPGRFRVLELPVELPPGRFELQLRAPEAPGEGLSAAFDWIQVRGLGWRVPLDAAWPRILIAGVFGLALFLGFAPSTAAALAGVLALALGLFAALDPAGCVHVLRQVTLPALLSAGLAGVIVRRRPHGRWVALIFLLGYLVKGAGVFHPRYFYPDVRLFGRYTRALGETAGTLPERSLIAQVRTNTAYPRFVAGKPYAFPYSPLFFLPFSWLPEGRDVVENALKHVALAAAAAEVLAVFWLAGLLTGERSGLAAAWLVAFLPPLFSRLLYAMYATIVGHLFDLLAIGLAMRWLMDPAAARRYVAFGGAVLASLLTYVSSLFNIGGFVGWLAVLDRRRAARVLLVGVLAATVTIVLLYLPFTLLFFQEIVPSLLTHAASRTDAGAASGWTQARLALGRIPLFYGWLYPALAAAGLFLLRGRADVRAYRVLLAYACAFLTLVGLRALGAGLFKDLKEVEFAGPLVALTAGAALETLAARGRAGLAGAVLLAAGLTGFGLWRYAEYLAARTLLIGLG